MKKLCILSLVAGLLSTASAANLIGNGSFESPAIVGPFAGISAGGTIGAWRVGLEDVDLIRTYWNAADGAQSVDLNGPRLGSSIFQDIPTTVGAQYSLTFSYAGNPDEAGDKTFNVLWGGAVAGGFNFPQNTGTLANMNWRNGVLTLTANSSLTRVEFLSTTAINGTGPALDNISLTAVPEPSVTLLALTSAAGLLALRLRRQRDA